MTLLDVEGISKRFVAERTWYGGAKTWNHAVTDVSFRLDRGETLALVGESGTGKSTAARMVMRLITPDSGAIRFDGVDLMTLRGRRLREHRNRMQMIFQDPYSSFDPRVPVGDSVLEPLRLHSPLARAAQWNAVYELLERVGLGPEHARAYPGELSGGQLQRAAIARALTLRPALLVCDEPTAALDVSVRAQVLNLMHELQQEYDMAYLFISHDLALVQVIADRVAVMHSGTIVEQGDIDAIYEHPREPYTRELLDAIPAALPPGLR
ncbi:ATP-binding cassette domain-containing protein [Microbacterium sp. X-17]|uniref:ATP-binding cassette domain-containing protein n=1 Tax=Microbacterium sp. X-17 TaxID=3144404 RepID=UPI0031F5C81E